MIDFRSGGYLVTGLPGEFVRRSGTRVYANQREMNLAGQIHRQPTAVGELLVVELQEETGRDETRTRSTEFSERTIERETETKREESTPG